MTRTKRNYYMCTEIRRIICRIVLMSILFCSLIILQPSTSRAETIASGKCGASAEWTLDNNGLLTITGSGYITSDPWEYKEGNQHQPDDPQFTGEIKKVVINQGILNIPDGAFKCCPSLSSVTIPESVYIIGNHSFWFCESLSEITFPSGLKTIGSYAFTYSGLVSVVIPNGVETIGRSAFANCEHLQSIQIPTSLHKIEDFMFEGCVSLKQVSLPDSVTSIGYYVFRYCSELRSVRLPANISCICSQCFFGCEKLTTIENSASDSVNYIEHETFMNCYGLTKVYLSKNMEIIGKDAYAGCWNITDVYYNGTKEDKEKLNIEGGNEALLNATWHYEWKKNANIDAFVTRCYRVILGREPDAGGLAYWIENLRSGKEKASGIINGFVTSNEFKNKRLSDEVAVEILYNAMLGRPSDEGGKNYWLSVLNGGNPFAAVINGFCTSTEFKNLCASYGIEPGAVKTGPLKPAIPVKDMTKIRAFVTRCYQVILNRDPEDAGLEYWAKSLANDSRKAAEIIDGFVNSREYQNRKLSAAESIEILYKAMLGRNSEEAGRIYWMNRLNAGEPFAAIINGFCTSQEFKNLCSVYGIQPGSVKVANSGIAVSGVSDINSSKNSEKVAEIAKHLDEGKVKAHIRKCYMVLLGREANDDELAYWTETIIATDMTVAKAMYDIVLSNEFSRKSYSNEELVRRLYQAYTNREPGKQESLYWIEKLNAGESLESIAIGFSRSGEFKTIENGLYE